MRPPPRPTSRDVEDAREEGFQRGYDLGRKVERLTWICDQTREVPDRMIDPPLPGHRTYISWNW